MSLGYKYDLLIKESGLAAEREKAGLLPPRSREEGLPVSPSARRPADVWQPRGISGASEAWDFSISSGLAAQFRDRAASNPEEVIAIIENRKRTYMNTEEICNSAGFQFVPMILEAHGGGWSPSIRKAVNWISAAGAARGIDTKAAWSLQMAQRISCSLQRENALAILRRTAAQSLATAPAVQVVAEDVDATMAFQ